MYSRCIGKDKNDKTIKIFINIVKLKVSKKITFLKVNTFSNNGRCMLNKLYTSCTNE